MQESHGNLGLSPGPVRSLEEPEIPRGHDSFPRGRSCNRDCQKLSLGRPGLMKGGWRGGQQLLQRTEMLHGIPSVLRCLGEDGPVFHLCWE